MKQEDIIRMAREAGLGATLTHFGGDPRVWIEGADWHDELQRFANAIEAAAKAEEREECAKVCESRYMGDNNREDMEARACAAAIRARDNNAASLRDKLADEYRSGLDSAPD